MRNTLKALALTAALAVAPALFAQEAQQTETQQNQAAAQQVARPGGTLPGNPSIQLVKVAEGLVDPVNVTSAGDGSGQLFVMERVGRIRIIDQNGELLEEPFLDIRALVKIDFLEQGLLGAAFHPNYSENGLFYIYYNHYSTNGDTFIVEYQVSEDNPNVANPDSARVVMTVDQPFVNHNGGTINFGPDGYLYIALGDGGSAGDPYETAQNVNDLLGSLLRIDVDDQGSNQRYGIPEDNPFAQAGVEARPQGGAEGLYYPAAQREIWAYGLRNPWQFSFDRQTGDLYIADVGQGLWEEINFQPAGSEGGQNYGWDIMEGAHCFPADADCGGQFGVLPVAEYDHSQGDCSITGIGVYRGDDSPALDGIYFNSDYCSGRFWGLARDDGGNWVYQELLDTELLVTGAGSDETGELYVTTCTCVFGRDYNPYEQSNGTVWRIVAADQVPEGAETATTAAEEEATEEEQEEAEDEGVAGDADEAEEENVQQEDSQQQTEEEGQQGEQDQEEQQQDEQQQEQQDGQSQEEQQEEQPEQEEQNQGGQGQNQEAVAQLGQEVYQSICIACHGANGEGTVGPALAGNQALQDAAHVARMVIHGGSGMPAFGPQLSDEQIAAVATFVRNSWENDFGPVSIEQVEALR